MRTLSTIVLSRVLLRTLSAKSSPVRKFHVTNFTCQRRGQARGVPPVRGDDRGRGDRVGRRALDGEEHPQIDPALWANVELGVIIVLLLLGRSRGLLLLLLLLRHRAAAVD